MVFVKSIGSLFKFLTEAGFRKRKYHIADSMCDESYVFKRKNVCLEIELNFCTDEAQNIERIMSNIDNSWHINFYVDIDSSHENLLFCNLFEQEELAQLREQLLDYEFMNVQKQLEIYADFIKRHLDMILEI